MIYMNQGKSPGGDKFEIEKIFPGFFLTYNQELCWFGTAFLHFWTFETIEKKKPENYSIT